MPEYDTNEVNNMSNPEGGSLEERRQRSSEKATSDKERKKTESRIASHARQEGMKDASNTKQETLQLYEKGMLSAESVLEAFGFDPNQEADRKKNDALNMNAMADSVSASQGRKERFSEGFEEITQTIESARRNFEACSKILVYLHDSNREGSDLGKETIASMLKSIKVMDRVKNLDEIGKAGSDKDK